VLDLPWDDVDGASVETTGKGRVIVRVTMRGAASPRDHKHDPLAVKAASGQEKDAAKVVASINEEAATRRRWRELAERDHREAEPTESAS
jgi:hypothetical protein